MKPWMVVAVAVVSGCMGAAMHTLVIPPAGAQSVRRWDHLCFEGKQPADIQTQAKAAGAEGWEMVAAGTYYQNYAVYCFKRPLP